MKTRTGFVSNSSSSSFIVFGISADKVDAIEMSMKAHPETFMTQMAEVIPSALEDFLEQNPGYDDDYVALGGDPSAITTENLATVFDGAFIEFLAEEGSEYDLFYRLPLGKGIDFTYSHESEEDGGVVGISMGSVEYGVDEQFDIADLLKAAETLKAAGIIKKAEDAAVYTIYTGY